MLETKNKIPMKALESLFSTPLLVSLIGGMGIVLRGRADAEDLIIPATDNARHIGFDPMLGLAVLGMLLISGAILIAREMRIEAKQARLRKMADDFTQPHPRTGQYLQHPPAEA